MGMTDTNKTDTGWQSHKTDEVCHIFMGMTNLEKTINKTGEACVVIPAFLIFFLPQ
jgi:hypothetical protein